MISDEITQRLEKIIPIITKDIATDRIEYLVAYEGMDYTEACLHFCEEHSLDPEEIGPLIVGPLKEKIRAEAARKNYLPRTNSLYD